MTTEPIEGHAIRASDLIALTARLAEVLAEENDHLDALRIAAIEPLQEEKLLLAEALAVHKHYIDGNPDVLEAFDDDEREDLLSVTQVFRELLSANFQKLTIARNVNGMVRQAIAETLAELSPLAPYGISGKSDEPDTLPPVSLDQRI